MNSHRQQPGLFTVPFHVLTDNDGAPSEEDTRPVQWQLESDLSTSALQPRTWDREVGANPLLLTRPAPQVIALIPDAFGEKAFPADECLFQNGANHEAGAQQKLGVQPKGKRLLRKFVPHWSSHG